MLYKDTNLRVARVLIPFQECKSKYYVLKDDPENIHRLKMLRRTKKFTELTDQQILYLVNKETLRLQEEWSQNQRIYEFRVRFKDSFHGHLSHWQL